MPDVRMPDGTLIRGVPDGTTKAELQRKLGLAQPQESEFSEDAQAIYRQHGLLPSKFSKEQEAAMLPKIGGVVGALAVPGAGWGALALQSLSAAGGAAAGKLGEQAVTDQPLDPVSAFKTGAVEGAGTLAGGGIVKSLGFVAKAAFGSRLSPAEQVAMEVAGKEGAPFPTSIVNPSPAQKFADKFVLGKLGNQQQANRVTQYLNQRVGILTEKAQVFDGVARRGQEYLRGVLESGETALREVFEGFGKSIGEGSRVPIGRTKSVAHTALESLNKTGDVKNPLAARLRMIVSSKKMGDASLNPTELNALMMGLTKDTFSRGTNPNRVAIGKNLMESLAKDMDEYGQQHGLNFLKDYAEATAERADYRELAKIPQLVKLSQEFGSKSQAAKGSLDFMSSLFRSGNGKALSKIRELNPELYHDLADAWVAQNINRFSHEQGVIRTLDGKTLRTWYEQNADTIKEALGKPQALALDNFSRYAAIMSEPAAKTGSLQEMLKGVGFSGLVGTGFGLASKPALIIPGEAAAFVLTRGLSDPSSPLFKLFTAETTKAFVRRGGQLSGQAVAD